VNSLNPFRNELGDFNWGGLLVVVAFIVTVVLTVWTFHSLGPSTCQGLLECMR
jgi:hypothetical protein